MAEEPLENELVPEVVPPEAEVVRIWRWSVKKKTATVVRLAAAIPLLGFAGWLLQNFLQLRGVVDLLASRIDLAFLWLALTLAGCVATIGVFRRNKLTAGIIAFVSLAIVLGLDWWAPKPMRTIVPRPQGADTLKMELAPLVLIERGTVRLPGENEKFFFHYGLGAVLRVSHDGSDVVYVRQLEVVGDINVSVDEYLQAHWVVGTTLDELAKEFQRSKPFRSLSWVAYPAGDTKLDPFGDEKFIRLLIVEPKNSIRWMTSVDDKPPQLSDYFGSHDNNVRPKALTRMPTAFDLVTFSYKTQDGQLHGAKLRNEVLVGAVHFRIRTNTGIAVIEPSNIRPVQWIFREDWDNVTPQELFFKDEIRTRDEPVTVDPLIK
jgi:hypothetical protein